MAAYGMLWDVMGRCGMPMGCYGLLWVGYGLAMGFRSLTPSRHIPVALLNLDSPPTSPTGPFYCGVGGVSISCYLWVSSPSTCDPLTALQTAPPPSLDAPTIHYLLLDIYPFSTILNVVQYRLVSPTTSPHLLKLSTLPKLLL